jgi:ABC-type proline/glycine betaine transport system permease subunit
MTTLAIILAVWFALSIVLGIALGIWLRGCAADARGRD